MSTLNRIVILGASGDLTRRYLLPALAELLAAARLPDGFEVIAADRTNRGTDAYRADARDWLAQHAPDVPAADREALLAFVRHQRADATDHHQVRDALQPDRGPAAVYIALPPSVLEATLEALIGSGMPAGSRVAVEKPFGTGLDHARELNRLLGRCVPEEAVFRIDHFLGMHAVQNIVGLRFGNRVFEPIWNAAHIEQVAITWDETLTLEGRGYYDTVGALRDLVQSHLLQLLALVAMEPPAQFDAAELRDRKADLLRVVRRLSTDEVAARTVRGRYTAGQIGGRSVSAYVDEDLVDPSRRTETFVQVTLEIDNWRWSGVPFTLRTGKALSADNREILIRFRPVPLRAIARSASPNVLRIPLEPEALSLQLNITRAGEPFALDTVQLSRHSAAPELPPYAHVLAAFLTGDASLSIGGDEAEQSWEIVDPILDAWREGVSPLVEYPAGSKGPEVAKTTDDEP